MSVDTQSLGGLQSPWAKQPSAGREGRAWLVATVTDHAVPRSVGNVN